jgi:hypothetical protein
MVVKHVKLITQGVTKRIRFVRFKFISVFQDPRVLEIKLDLSMKPIAMFGEDLFYLSILGGEYARLSHRMTPPGPLIERFPCDTF